MSKNKRTRREPAKAHPLTALPFVAPSEQGRAHYWNVPPTGENFRDHIEAESIGRQYATQYAQWLRANPDLVGMGTLGGIAADIDFKDPTRTGYWLGFFSCIEGFLFEASAND